MISHADGQSTLERILDLAIRIQQVPAPTFKERQRALFVRNLLASEGLQDVAMDRQQNVHARLPGRQSEYPIVVTAHLDTVFAGKNMLVSRQAGRICGPGIGDNSLGVAALLGLAWLLRETPEPLEADVWLVANTCEEGLGDLRGMKAVVDRFGDRVRAYLVLEGTALGQIYHRAVGVQRYRVTVTTPGGHSWTDYGRPSAVHELAALITDLTGLPLPARPRTTMNVGTIRGGTGINVLASQAQFDLDLRSESADVLARLSSEVQEKMRDRSRNGVDVQVESIGQRPAGQIPPDHPLVQLAVECLTQEGIEPSLTSGSTDANIPLSRGIPAVVLGITTGTGAHTEQECIDLAPAQHGMNQLVSFVRKLSKRQ